jgi:alkanesulfonate monooxygenase SsuD/methylene tetrahydromethanopterin reductase-like flavin-dependent oxidoreductase (luciferase family)
MGLFLPPLDERFARLEDTLRLAAHMWTGDESPFHGTHLRLERPLCVPRAISAPRPQILIGGSGPTRTLRLVAQYADASNLFDIPDGGITLRRNLATLAEHCAAVGRDPHDIVQTVSTAYTPGETADQLVERCRRLEALGIDHAVFIPRGRPWSRADADVLGAANRTLAA